ncbi:hypothetical protein CIY_00760 [Butyrivibrio fibrisolvens 16/4]|nr:hypothetical protein CIY_00760 [Butyrivibrio fibrisolvens 16/4]
MKENDKLKLYENLVDSYGFSEERSVLLKSIYSDLTADVKNLYVLYSIIKNDREIAWYGGDVVINPAKDSLEISYHSSQAEFAKEEVKGLVAHTITIIEGILPQGTLVELDLEKIKVPNPTSTQLYVVITKRFIGEETGPFYQYGGDLYPTGNFGTGKTLFFTPAAIKRVVHMGYESEIENQFVYEMLDGLVVDEHRLSMGFVPQKGA